MNFTFRKTSDDSSLIHLQNDWRATLTAPQDGMWEAFMNMATHWEIRIDDKVIGYACVNDDNQLLQFYITPQILDKGQMIFQQFVNQEKITTGIIGTNNPTYLSIANHFQNTMRIHSYQFSDVVETKLPEMDGEFSKAKPSDLNRLVAFCNYSTGAPKEWLNVYYENLIKRGELFIHENEEKIIGTSEVRKSDTNKKVADIGMVVSPDFRKQGYGTYLLGKAKEISKQEGRLPICSCEKDNIGSLKSIHKCGFRSVHQILEVEFKTVG